ncbi:hypothetical protein [Ponticaulis profundi]|uniref:DUF4440 domain-containing protein n=1 Tax=Ponticaulis profundi TaxID=2665222 RepID=A0ABW1S778_9PROT
METVKKRGSGAGKWIAIGVAVLVLLSLGTCVMSFGGLFAASLETQKVNQAFMDRVFEEGLPEIDDPIYRDGAPGWSPRAISQLTYFVHGAGEVLSSEQPSCTAHSDDLNADVVVGRVECVTQHEHPDTTATSNVVWVQEDGEWKVSKFDYRLENRELAAELMKELGLNPSQ